MAKTHRMSLVDLRLIALCGLYTNDTITTYTFEGGVEQRQPANPYLRLLDSFDTLSAAIDAATQTAARATRELQQ